MWFIIIAETINAISRLQELSNPVLNEVMHENSYLCNKAGKYYFTG